MTDSLEVKRGDIYWVDWGKEAGLHPALIIQNDIGNKHSDSTIVAYITSTPPKELPIIVGFKEHESSLAGGGAVDLGRIMTIPKSMLREKIGHISSRKIPQINEAILASLGID